MKKILIVINVVPDAVRLKNKQSQNNFGGWISIIIEILKTLGNSIGVVYPCVKKQSRKCVYDGVSFYPLRSYSKIKSFLKLSDIDVENILNDFKPDILYLEGTEMVNNYRFAVKMPGCYILSIQGILNEVYAEFYGGLTLIGMVRDVGLKAVAVYLGLVFIKKIVIKPKLDNETFLLNNARLYVGRTDWDNAHIPFVQRQDLYIKIQRPLRSVFYNDKWCINKCRKRRLFVGNGKVSYKGLHDVLKAVKMLVDIYPDIEVHVASGEQDKSSIKKYLKYSYYTACLIERLKIADRVKLLGELSAEEVKRSMLSSHVFVLASHIENSPNTLAEAMILGVPSIVSHVGGVSSMTTHCKSSYIYNAGDVVVLAYYIKRIFDNDYEAVKLSKNSTIIAEASHDIQAVTQKFKHLVNIVS